MFLAVLVFIYKLLQSLSRKKAEYKYAAYACTPGYRIVELEGTLGVI